MRKLPLTSQAYIIGHFSFFLSCVMLQVDEHNVSSAFLCEIFETTPVVNYLDDWHAEKKNFSLEGTVLNAWMSFESVFLVRCAYFICSDTLFKSMNNIYFIVIV